jgi:hypothetical protein
MNVKAESLQKVVVLAFEHAVFKEEFLEFKDFLGRLSERVSHDEF